MHLPREKKMSTCSDLLSPMVPDQGFVSPGEHLLSPCPPGDGDRSNFLASPMLGSDVNPLFVNPPSLQVQSINHLQHFIVPMVLHITSGLLFCIALPIIATAVVVALSCP